MSSNSLRNPARSFWNLRLLSVMVLQCGRIFIRVFLHGGYHPTLLVQSAGHALHVCINGQLAGFISGTQEDRRITFKEKGAFRSLILKSISPGRFNGDVAHHGAWKNFASVYTSTSRVGQIIQRYVAVSSN